MTDLVALNNTPEQPMVIRAYRGFGLRQLYVPESGSSVPVSDYVLVGAFELPWKTGLLTAECWVDKTLGELPGEIKEYGRATACAIHLVECRCTCGIYAMADRNDDRMSSSAVVAEVVLWGWVVPGTVGYRAQYAEILQLWIKDVLPNRDMMTFLIDRLKARYNVPVFLDVPRHEITWISGQPYCSCARSSWHSKPKDCPNRQKFIYDPRQSAYISQPLEVQS